MLSLEQQNALREQYRQANPGWRPATEVYADLVHRYLRPDSQVLDVGCGRGGLVEQLDHPLQQVVGADPDLRSLREHRLANLPRAAALSQCLPFRNHSFDLIVASWVLEHLAHPEQDFREFGRLLRPGGRFVFITPNRRHPLITFNHFIGRFSVQRFSKSFTGLQDRLVSWLYGRAPDDTFPAYYHANTSADVHRLAEKGGMNVSELYFIPDPTYLAFAPALFYLLCRIEGRLPAGRQLHLVGSLLQPD